MTREEHLEWAKKRALEYWERSEFLNAWTSLASDLSKHDELKDHIGLKISEEILINGMYKDPEFLHRWIVGFR